MSEHILSLQSNKGRYYLYVVKHFLLICCGCLAFLNNSAQHCPWDCSGMIIIETPVPKEKIYALKPVLVDEERNVIIDTIYGTDEPTYDRCDLMFYDDFVKDRTGKIAIHPFYEYDTFYHFASGEYVVKYNYCKYREEKLYLQYSDPYAKSTLYHYIEIPNGIRIHLHDYNNQLRERKTEEIKADLKNSVLILNCNEWNLKKPDCKEQVN
jgi:hypothetical protein